MPRVVCRILGSLESTVDGASVEVASPRERAVLGLLLLHAGEVVSIDGLTDGVWGQTPPTSARHLVHEYVSRLRSGLDGVALISTRAPGYVIECDACELDVADFTALVAAARAAREAGLDSVALRRFDEALTLWRGSVLCDVALEGDGRTAAARLDDQRRTVQSERVSLALALGRHHELIPDLERAVAAEPLDEQLRAQLMLALYRSGRQADALARYREGRQMLMEQIGVEPSVQLRELERSILRHDPALAPPSTKDARAEGAGAPEDPQRPTRRRRAGIVAAAALVLVGGAAAVVAFTASRGPPAVQIRGDAVAIIDASSARLVGSVPVTSPPGAIAYGAGSVWVSSPDARSITRISPGSRQMSSIPLDVPAQSLAVAGNAVWAVGSGSSDLFLTLERIDPTFGSVTRARRLPFVVTGDSGSVSGRGRTLLIAPRSGLLTRIDTRSGRTLSQVDPNAAPSAAAIGFGSSWLAYREADMVVGVDQRGAITQIPVGRGPSAIAAGKRAVWVANALDGTVKSIDPATGAVITTIAVGSDPTAIAAAGDSIWVANAGDGTLTRIDARTGRITAKVEAGGSPQSLAVGAGRVWASVQTPPRVQPEGGTIVVGVPPFMTTLDPAVAFNGAASTVLYATCTWLLSYPDEPGAAGMRLVPDAARALPDVSKDGRSYTYTIRPGLRFSPPSNQPVTAETFKYSIERSSYTRLERGGPPGQMFLEDVVGAQAYFAGKARHIAGIEAHGDRLTVHLTEPAPDLPARLATSLFCAVPTDTPIRPIFGPLPSAGPYYVAQAIPKRGFVLLRNPSYHGDRPHRSKRIEIVINPSHPIAQIQASKLDYTLTAGPAQDAALARIGRLVRARRASADLRQRYHTTRTTTLDYLELNTRRQTFHEARVRRAASYAIDRRALAAAGGTFGNLAVPAQMGLPQGMPGYRDAHIYPLVPDLAAARPLAGRGHHDAELYCVLEGAGPRLAQIVKNDLAAIGIDVHIRCMPGDEFYNRLSGPNEPWDIAIESYGADYNDPADLLNGIANNNTFNFNHYHDLRLSREIHAASRLAGVTRARAYGRIDLALTRDVVPRITFGTEIGQELFSSRVGCLLDQPAEGVDLAALCVRPA